MYQQILAKLLIKFAGLPKSFLGLLAKQLEAKVTEESQIEGAITELDQQFSIKTLGDEYQREGDRRVTDARKEWDLKNPRPADPGPPDPKPTPPAGEVPEWAKSLINEVQLLRKDKVQGSIKQQAAEKLKDVPASFWRKWALPDKEEDLDAFINDVTTDWTTFRQEQINAGLMNAEKPAGGGSPGSGAGGGAASDKAIDAEIEAWANKDKPKK